MLPPRQIKMGISMHGLGYHPGAWRHPKTAPGANMQISHYIHMAQTVERGLFDIVFLADSVGLHDYDEPPGSLSRISECAIFEPMTLLGALAMVTKNVGLIASASTTYNAPFHVARKIASLDHISGGRAGWNVVTSHTDMEAQNFGLDANPDYDSRYDRAAEFVKVVRGLWDTWDDDAFLHDKSSGIHFDQSKMHVLNHQGKYYKVRGPLTVAPTPQRHPVIAQAGASDQGQELAAESANVIYSAARNIEQAKAYYASVKGRMAKYGRDPSELKILPGLMAIVGRTEAEAQAKYQQLQDLIDPLLGLQRLAATMGDLSGYPLDGPVPLLPEWRLHSRGEILYQMAKERNLTIRQLYLAISAGNGHFKVIGTPTQIADHMQNWFENGAADGFNFLPVAQPAALEDFVDLVVPELQKRGLFRTAYEGPTLRDLLGVGRPISRYARTDSAAAE